jgi:hypothetical protein
MKGKIRKDQVADGSKPEPETENTATHKPGGQTHEEAQAVAKLGKRSPAKADKPRA